MIYLIGVGCSAGNLTKEAADALHGAACLIGAKRLLTMFAESACAEEEERELVAATRPEEILTAIRAAEERHAGADVAILFSGDSGFYSGTRRLLPLLREDEMRVLPGISSLQAFAARCGRSWQEWRLCSAHGAECDAVKEVCGGRPVFFLTGGTQGPAQLCQQLTEAGLGELPVIIGQDLCADGERIVSGKAQDFTETAFAPLNVMLAEAAPRPYRRTPGFPDETFERQERIPMTKQIVRAAILAELAPGPDDICWDVGAGTGSVAIELALQAGAVYGVERNVEALELAERNRRRMGAWNLRLSEGCAPESLRELPAPDCVFVGGSGGGLQEILTLIHEKNARARVCVSAVTIETVAEAVDCLETLGYETTCVQIGVSRSRRAAGKHLMMAENAIWLITGVCP